MLEKKYEKANLDEEERVRPTIFFQLTKSFRFCYNRTMVYYLKKKKVSFGILYAPHMWFLMEKSEKLL